MSPTEVITTVLTSSPIYPLHSLIIAILFGLLMKLCSPAIHAEFASGQPPETHVTKSV